MEIGADLFLDRVGDPSFKITQRVLAFGRDAQMRTVPDRFGSHQPGLDQLAGNLLQCEIIRVFFFQDEAENLRFG